MKPQDYVPVVRAHHKKTACYLLVAREPCIGIAQDEANAIDRNIQIVSHEDLEDLDLPPSWLLAFVVCPGDSVAPLARWVKARRARGRRIRFFLHPSTDDNVLRSWEAAGLGLARGVAVSTWQELHPHLGRALNDTVYLDALGREPSW